MQKIIFFALLGVNLVIKTQAFAYESVATLISIQDGDTLSAVVRGEKNKIRLLNIDCYETKNNSRATFQHKYYSLSYEEIYKKGRQSKKILENLLNNHKYIRVKWEKRDNYGRILGNVYLDDLKSSGTIDINRYMLKNGGCNKYVAKNALKK